MRAHLLEQIKQSGATLDGVVLPPGPVRASSEAEEALFDLVDQYDRAYQAAATSVSLTAAQACVLGRLNQPRGMKQLAAELGCDASNITQIAVRLEKLGLAQRVDDPADGRARTLRRTSKGAKVNRRFEQAFGFARAAVDRLTPTEQASLSALIRKALD